MLSELNLTAGAKQIRTYSSALDDKPHEEPERDGGGGAGLGWQEVMAEEGARGLGLATGRHH